MDDRIKRFRVGVMVLATLLITGTLVVLFGNFPSLVQDTYELKVSFHDATGISPNAPVRKSGILVGRVKSVDLKDNRALVTMAIQSSRKLPRSDFCRIAGSLLGDMAVQFVEDSGAPPTTEVFQAGDMLEGIDNPDAMQVFSRLEPKVEKMLDSVTKTSDEMRKFSGKVQELLSQDDGQLARTIQKMEKTLDSVRGAMDNLNDVLGDPQLKADFRQSVAELPKVLKESREAFSGIKDTLSLADRNLQNLEGFTRPLGQRGDELFLKLDRGAVKMERLLDQLVTFSQSLNNRQGSLGRLVNDPELYDNLNDAAENINQLTRQLRPIVSDVRVFTDKIARDPSRIGVKGVFQQSSGIK